MSKRGGLPLVTSIEDLLAVKGQLSVGSSTHVMMPLSFFITNARNAIPELDSRTWHHLMNQHEQGLSGKRSWEEIYDYVVHQLDDGDFGITITDSKVEHIINEGTHKGTYIFNYAIPASQGILSDNPIQVLIKKSDIEHWADESLNAILGKQKAAPFRYLESLNEKLGDILSRNGFQISFTDAERKALLELKETKTSVFAAYFNADASGRVDITDNFEFIRQMLTTLKVRELKAADQTDTRTKFWTKYQPWVFREAYDAALSQIVNNVMASENGSIDYLSRQAKYMPKELRGMFLSGIKNLEKNYSAAVKETEDHNRKVKLVGLVDSVFRRELYEAILGEFEEACSLISGTYNFSKLTQVAEIFIELKRGADRSGIRLKELTALLGGRGYQNKGEGISFSPVHDLYTNYLITREIGEPYRTNIICSILDLVYSTRLQNKNEPRRFIATKINEVWSKLKNPTILRDRISQIEDVSGLFCYIPLLPFVGYRNARPIIDLVRENVERTEYTPNEKLVLFYAISNEIARGYMEDMRLGGNATREAISGIIYDFPKKLDFENICRHLGLDIESLFSKEKEISTEDMPHEASERTHIIREAIPLPMFDFEPLSILDPVTIYERAGGVFTIPRVNSHSFTYLRTAMDGSKKNHRRTLTIYDREAVNLIPDVYYAVYPEGCNVGIAHLGMEEESNELFLELMGVFDSPMVIESNAFLPNVSGYNIHSTNFNYPLTRFFLVNLRGENGRSSAQVEVVNALQPNLRSAGLAAYHAEFQNALHPLVSHVQNVPEKAWFYVPMAQLRPDMSRIYIPG
ncbi:MAG: hypothetical protein NDI94_06705 [Candidatus Woesearchaeota archaeon]|nr:hypothetical protein [Candidatus Woesearchaeota archaeon]